MEILDTITATPSSEVDQPLGEAVDTGSVRRFAQAHEDTGFDRVLVGYFSSAAEGAVVSSFVAVATQRLGVLLAYYPGVIAAPLAACQLAILDQFSEGRLALNAVSGGSDEDLTRDGDYLDHDRCYARIDGYLQALRAIWIATGSVDFDGEFYRSQGASSAVRPCQSPHISIYSSGSPDAAIEVAVRHADTYILWGELLVTAGGHIRRVHTTARAQGRDSRFSMPFRLIVADIGEAAWECAAEVLEQVRENRARLDLPLRDHQPQNVGSQRLLAVVEQGEVRDSRLWTGVTRLTEACWNSTALVDTPEQVAATLGEYYWLDVLTFLIRGFGPLGDVVRYGQGLIPAMHNHIARLPLLRHAG